jgi:hypothetical protein
MAKNRLADFGLSDTSVPHRDEQVREVHSIGEVLEELFTQYQARFPGLKIVVLETPATAAV